LSPPISKLRTALQKDPDQELFEFLNNPEVVVDHSGGGGNMADSGTEREHSRPPSTSSSLSSRSRRTPEGKSSI